MLALQVDQQIDHLGLDRHVERGDRFVTHDQPRLQRQRAGNADALALSTRKLVRVVLHLVGPQADLREELCHALLLFLARCQAMHAERFADDVARGHPRIERGEGVLEYDLHRAPDRPQRTLAEMGDVGSIDADMAARWLDQPQHAARDCGFATAGLSDQPQRFAFAKRKADAIDRMHRADGAAQHAGANRIMLDEVGDLEQGALFRHDAAASSAARQHAAA